MIPLSTLVTITSSRGTEITKRFNLFRSVEINGVPGRGYTSGQALAALEEVFKRDDAEGDGLRLLQSVVPGKGGAAAGADLRPGHRLRVPPAGRPVRELAPAMGGPARLAAGRPRLVLRRLAAWATTTTSTSRSATSC